VREEDIVQSLPSRHCLATSQAHYLAQWGVKADRFIIHGPTPTTAKQEIHANILVADAQHGMSALARGMAETHSVYFQHVITVAARFIPATVAGR
jgi:hypothetical protein